MQASSIALLFLVLVHICTGEFIVLSNNLVSFQFDQETFGLASIQDAKTQHEYLLSANPQLYPVATLWTVQFVDAAGFQYFLSNTNVVYASKTYAKQTLPDGTQELQLMWHDIAIANEPQASDILVRILLPPSSALATFKMQISHKSKRFGIWTVTFASIANIRTKGKAYQVLQPSGFGEVYNGGSGSFNLRYPGGSCTMGFMAIIQDDIHGLYYGAHDAHANVKNLIYNADTFDGVDIGNSTHEPRSMMQMMHYPLDMTRIQTSFNLSYDLIIGVFTGDWWDATQIYKNWSLKEAEWTKQGNVATRNDIPEWFKQLGLWINTCWTFGALECEYGDPDLVVKAVSEVKQKWFPELPVALHYYCYHEIPFDTSYAEFLPAKQGFKEAVQKLTQIGVKVVPYINGRIVDYNANMFNQTTLAASAKSSAPRIKPKHLSTYMEVYGSQQQQAVMCPTQPYWHQVMSDLVYQFTRNYGTSGVYIDQIAAAQADLCFDESHGHTLGGGNYWYLGYKQLLAQVNARKDPNAIIMTESNAEVYMADVPLYLPVASLMTCQSKPLFQSVYGGYHISMGRIFYKSDLTFANGIPFALRFAQMFMFGQQLGWFSLGGNLGLYSLVSQPEFAPFAKYINVLAKFRLVGASYIAYGQALRDLVYESPTITMAGSWWNSPCTFPLIWASAYKSYNSSNSIAIFTTNVSTQQALETNLNIVPSKYGLRDGARYVVYQVFVDGTSTLRGTFSGTVPLHVALPALDFQMYTITAV